MPKFKLICEHDDKNKLQHEFEEDFLSDAVMNIASFLKGCGYEFGSLKVVSINDTFDLNNNNDDLFYPYNDEDDLLFSDYDNFFDDNVLPVDENAIMNWTVNEINKQPEPKEKCPICKIEKEIMKNHNCYDSSCPKGKVEGW